MDRNIFVLKTELRKSLLQKRNQISKIRRDEAEQSLLDFIKEQLKQHFDFIISFSSFSSEISTDKLNSFLCEKRVLVLPKMSSENSLSFFHVKSLEDLEFNSFGILEPKESLCEKIEINSNILMLVPGLGFDENSNRIGYGKGYYDRFLRTTSCFIKTIGIGFKEQLIAQIPIDKFDFQLSQHSLF